MHYWYSSIISRKCIIKFSTISIYYIYIQSLDVFLSFLEIIDRKRQYFKNDTLVFIIKNNEDLQHWYI